jgi:predicted site-specific integrase-resolvase
MASNKKPTWISEEEAAQLLGYKPKTLRKYINLGRITYISYVRLNRRKVSYNKVDIDNHLMQNAVIAL